MKQFTLSLFILIFSFFASYAQINLNLGLRAYYPFNGNANDASGNNNNPNFNNATLTSDRLGNANSAYHFNGTNNYMKIPNAPTLNMGNTMSIALWVKATGYYTGICYNNMLVMKGDDATSSGNYSLRFAPDPVNGCTPSPSTAVEQLYGNDGVIATTPFVQLNKWYSVVWTCDGTTTKIYVDCVLRGSGPSSGATLTNTRDLFLGHMDNVTFPYWLNGDLDEVRIYDRALNTDEINFLGGCNILPCDSWLHTPSNISYVTVGDIDVVGNQVTVEANVNRVPLPIDGHVVSKHTGPSDINYALSLANCEITTTNGYTHTNAICDPALNKTYHIAMVYDGSTLKFYRNGFLMNQVPCTGNMVNNNLLTTIGEVAGNGFPLTDQFIGYINEVRIWNVVRTQAQIRANMNSSLPNPATQPGLLAYYIFDDLLNKQGNAAFNGTISGAATINATNPSCNFIADSCETVIPSCNTAFDFTYKQDICNPLSVQFTGAGTSLPNPYWSFGDLITTTGTTTPTHVYAATGNYLVKFAIANPGCNDTISKMISITVIPADIIITPDTTICFGATKQLRSQPSLNFCWSPTTYLDNPLLPNPTTSATAPITYYFTAETVGNNIITNGDFSAGNTGFTSGYTYAAVNTTEGEYFVGPNPAAWNASLSSCQDHTSSGGNMLLVNGAPVADVPVWGQTVNVTPNTNYAFTTWIQALYPPNPAILSFSINGLPIGSLITASLPTCTWTRFYTTWNSGNNTTANISIVNKNTIVLGNDFALDDISFSPVTLKRDSVKITIDTPKVTALGSTTVCRGTAAQLNASGAASYSWTPPTGLSNANIANPVATPSITTIYTVSGTTIHGCTAPATVTVTILPKPAITKSNDTTICKTSSVRLFASGGTNYLWSPAATLDNPLAPNPLATPTASVTKYYVTVTNTAVNACTNKDSVTVTLRADPVFTVSPAKSTCQGTAVQLVAGGGNKYAWSPAGSVTDPTISNPFTTANATSNYSVLITDTVCGISSTLTTAVTVNPSPQVTASKSNDINCLMGSADLLATGAITYTWSPATGLNSSIIPNPVAAPGATTQYTVKGTDAFGCAGTDIITVVVAVSGTNGYYMPNSFTPNGDGKNDCFGIKNWGIVQELEFIIYNRYGEKVFSTTDPNKCWDGKYKSDKPEPGNYVYYIKAKTACGDVERKGNILLIR